MNEYSEEFNASISEDIEYNDTIEQYSINKQDK